MIELVNVTKYYLTDRGRHYVLRNVSLKLPHNINIAIIGSNGAGKSTLLRLMAGVDTPNSGKILRKGRISWPMGLTPGVQLALNGVENSRFASRIYGMPAEEIRQTIERVREIANIGVHFDLPVNTYSSGMRQRLAFAISMSLKFDYYLFDEIGAGGDRAFRKLAKELIDERLSSANFIMVSHSPGDIIGLCQAAILLRNGKATYFKNVRSALEAYGEREFLEKFDSMAEAKKPARRPARKAAGPAGGAAARTAEHKRRQLLRLQEIAARRGGPPVGSPQAEKRAAMDLARRRQKTLNRPSRAQKRVGPAAPAASSAPLLDKQQRMARRAARLQKENARLGLSAGVPPAAGRDQQAAPRAKWREKNPASTSNPPGELPAIKSPAGNRIEGLAERWAARRTDGPTPAPGAGTRRSKPPAEIQK